LTLSAFFFIVVLWFANNLLFLFHDAMMRLANRNSCAFMITLAAALFISLALATFNPTHLAQFSQLLRVEVTVP